MCCCWEIMTLLTDSFSSPLICYLFGLVGRVFASGPGDLGSVPGRVIPKTQKMVLDASLLNTQHYKVRIKGKVEQSREGVAPSPTPWCSSYRKGSLRVTLDYGRQLYLLYLLVCWSYKGIKDGKKEKTGIHLNSIFMFGVYPYYVVGLFPWTSKNSRIPRSRR